MSKQLKDVTDEEFKKWATDLKYQRFYSRWPVVDPKMRDEPVAELFHTVWTQYSKILDNGKGLDTILTIQRQINSEIEEIQKNLDGFPDDADSVYKYRLNRSLTLLNIRKTVLKKLITAYSVHGEIERDPDFELELNDLISKTIAIATDGQKVQRDNKKHAKEYLRTYSHIKKEQPGLSIGGYIAEVGMAEVSDNTYRKWIENYDEAEQMLSNDD